MLVYLAMYCWYLHKGFLLLRSRPYNSFRVGNILVRIQVASSDHRGFADKLSQRLWPSQDQGLCGSY